MSKPDDSFKIELSQFGVKAQASFDAGLNPSARVILESTIRLLEGYFVREDIQRALFAIVNKRQKKELEEIK